MLSLLYLYGITKYLGTIDMAFEVSAEQVEAPDATLVTKYTPYRLGVFPSVEIDYCEVKRDILGPFTVVDSLDLNNNSVFETFKLNATIETRLYGAEVVSGNVSYGMVVGFDEIANTVTVSSGSLQNIAGSALTFKLVSVTGSPAYRESIGGKRWKLTLSGNNPDAMSKIADLLTVAYINAVAAVMQKISANVTLQQIETGIIELAHEGVNIDSFLAEQAERLERDRRSGLTPYVSYQPK